MSQEGLFGVGYSISRGWSSMVFRIRCLYICDWIFVFGVFFIQRDSIGVFFLRGDVRDVFFIIEVPEGVDSLIY